MSLNSAMLAGASGLQAESSSLAAISNDIANVNTVGYKSTDVDFESLVTAQTDNGDYAAGGVNTVGQQLISQQGTFTQTSSPTDLAISGQGMFVVSTQPTSVSADNEAEFTRAGSFTPNADGYLENTAGLYLLGWPADSNGDITTSSSMSSLEPINVDSIAGEVSATTDVSVTANLDADQTVSAAATAAGESPAGTGAYNATTNSMTAYDATTGTGVEPDYTIQIPVSNSLGGQETLQLDLLKSSTPNQYYAEIQAVPPDSIQSGSGLAAGQIAAGVIAFNPDGSINMTDTTLFGTPPDPTLSIGASSTTPAAGAVSWATSAGAAAQSITFGIGGDTGSGDLTQYASSSSVQTITTNGTAFGGLSGVSINTDGIVTATFDNGTSRNIAQVAMATFPNVDGLTALNGEAYQASDASGAYSLNAPGSGGAGTLASSTLEASTVNLSTEFTNLIIAQQAYTASSKVITTADQMTQALLQVIQG